MILPAAALEQHIAVLGKNGSGKTYATKAVIVEPLLAAGKHVAIVDPTSAWWGLRTSKDGAGPGFKVLVLGGDHGDLPLPALGGEAVARLVIEQHLNVVADTGNLTVGERTRWMIDFAGAIYRMNRAPLHLVIDEAHVFAPQGKVPDPDTGKMLHAVNQLASGGRSRGIRLAMITQRPQKLHKDALTTADTLIAMRVLAPHDREAVKAWIDGCGDPTRGREVLDSLAGLQRGEGWVWYPEGDHLVRSKFPGIKTFDSSATPTDGHVRPAPKGSAEIDLTEIRKALAEAVSVAEANDPKRLRARISELERELKKGHAEPSGFRQADLDAARTGGYEDGWIAGMARAVQAIERDAESAKPSPAPGATRQAPAAPTQPHAVRPLAAPRPPTARHRPGNGQAPTGPAKALPRSILTALAQHPNGLTKGQILVHTGYRSSGTVSGAFAELTREGLITTEGGICRITGAGLGELGEYDPLPVGDALREHLLTSSKLSKLERAVLRTLFQSYPHAIGKAAILEGTGYASSGTTSGAFAKLVTLGYASKDGRGSLRAAEELFR